MKLGVAIRYTLDWGIKIIDDIVLYCNIRSLGQAKLIHCFSSVPAPYFRHLLQLSLLPSNVRHAHLLPCGSGSAHAHSFNILPKSKINDE